MQSKSSGRARCAELTRCAECEAQVRQAEYERDNALEMARAWKEETYRLRRILREGDQQ